MNYRHAFHAGNFADLVKHAGLTVLLDAMTAGVQPLTVIDTHAGAGAYDLTGEMARRSGEAEAGIGRLMAGASPPEAFDMLVAAVARANDPGQVTLYPGSPALICAALRPQDNYVACELRPDDHAALAALLAPTGGQAVALMADGFVEGPARTPRQGAVLALIDPPFERADDAARTAQAAADILARNPRAVVAVWLPLKDLESFDAFLRALEAADPPSVLVAEARLRPLSDPMRMNGCVLVIVNAPAMLDDPLRAICGWVASQLGETGAEARIWRL